MDDLVTFTLGRVVDSKVEKIARGNISAGVYHIDETVRIKGVLHVNPDVERVPTSSIPLLPVLAMMIRRLGIGRSAALKLLRECCQDAMSSDVNISDKIAESVIDYNNVLNLVKSEVVSQLPKTKVKGQTRFVSTTE
jgi:hypothetical protein